MGYLQSYQIRETKSNRNVIVFAIVITIVLSALTSHVIFGILAGIVVFIIQKFKSNKDNEFFLKKLEIDDPYLNVTYLKKEQSKTVTGTIRDFEILKKYTVERMAIAYLEIRYNNKLLL